MFVALLWGQAPQAAVASRTGNAVFQIPAAWQGTEQDGVVILSPQSGPGKKNVAIMILQGHELNSDFRKAFDQVLRKMHANLRVISDGQIQSLQADEGYPVLLTEVQTQDAAGDRSYRLYLAANPGSRFEMIMYLASSETSYRSYRPVLEQFVKNLNFANAPAMEQVAAQHSTLLPGSPPLTTDMVARFANFTEWLFGSAFTVEQHHYIKAMLIRDWQSGVVATIKEHLDVLEIEQNVLKASSGQRESMRRQMITTLVQSSRQRQNLDDRWLLSQYEAIQKQIAPGNPPLTRQIADAIAELVNFQCGEVTGNRKELSRSEKDANAQLLRQAWPGMTARSQLELSNTPFNWSALRRQWATSPESERAKTRKVWAANYNRSAPAQPLPPAVDAAVKELEALIAEGRARQLTPPEWTAIAYKIDVMLASAHWAAAPPGVVSEWQTAAQACRRNAAGVATGQDTLTSAERLRSASNLLMMDHVTKMNIISNMNVGGSEYRYEYKYGR